MYNNQMILDEYNYNLEKRRKLDQEILELNHEHASLQESATKLDNENKGELGKSIKKKLEIAARAKVANESNKQRIQRALITQQEKEEAYKDEQIMKWLEAKPIDEAKIKELAELQSKKELSQEKIQTLTEHRKAQAELSKAQSQAAWLESTEYKQMVEENVKKQNEINTLMDAKEKLDVLSELKKKTAESAYILQYKAEFSGNQDTLLVAQVNFLSKELDKTQNNVQERTNALSKFKQMQNENSQLSRVFAEQNPAIVNGISNYGANLSLDTLQEYISVFETFKQQYPQLRTT